MKRIIKTAAIILLIGAIAAPVMAWGPGKGGRGTNERGGGDQYSSRFGRFETLTPEQRDQLEAIHKKFYEETVQLRNDLMVKRAELNAALNTTNPDVEKAKGLQKEISDIQGTLAQKRIDRVVEERKINPEARYGYGQGYGWGHGRHMRDDDYGRGGSGRMKGGFGPGSCWN